MLKGNLDEKSWSKRPICDPIMFVLHFHEGFSLGGIYQDITVLLILTQFSRATGLECLALKLVLEEFPEEP